MPAFHFTDILFTAGTAISGQSVVCFIVRSFAASASHQFRLFVAVTPSIYPIGEGP